MSDSFLIRSLVAAADWEVPAEAGAVAFSSSPNADGVAVLCGWSGVCRPVVRSGEGSQPLHRPGENLLHVAGRSGQSGEQLCQVGWQGSQPGEYEEGSGWHADGFKTGRELWWGRVRLG